VGEDVTECHLQGWYLWQSVHSDGFSCWCATGPALGDPVYVGDSPGELLEVLADVALHPDPDGPLPLVFASVSS
jgi:hypothetical protein